jgi:hypothetical protein
VSNQSYQIKLPQFEGPFDLLVFFVERDELDIYNIPITKIINDFLDYIHSQESLNIELSSEFILFVSTLMRIKAKMLLPRKELDEQGNEIDPRQELIDKLLEYKRYKEAAARMAEMEAVRMLMVLGLIHMALTHRRHEQLAGLLIPLIIADGAGARSRIAIGMVIAFGMAIGTIFTLFVTPAIYTMLAHDVKAAPGGAALAHAGAADIDRAAE